MPDTILDKLIRNRDLSFNNKALQQQDVKTQIAEKINIVSAKLKEANMDSLYFGFQIPNSINNLWHEVSFSISDGQIRILFNNLLVYKNGVVGDNDMWVLYSLNHLLSSS